MKMKIPKLLRSKRGESYIDVVIMILVAIMVIVLALNVFSYLTLKQDLDYVASQVSQIASLEGMTSSAKITSVFNERCADENLNPDEVELEISAKQYYNSQKHEVQLGDTITITISCKTQFMGLGALSKAIEINCVSVKSSLSRVYWKD